MLKKENFLLVASLPSRMEEQKEFQLCMLKAIKHQKFYCLIKDLMLNGYINGLLSTAHSALHLQGRTAVEEGIENCSEIVLIGIYIGKETLLKVSSQP